MLKRVNTSVKKNGHALTDDTNVLHPEHFGWIGPNSDTHLNMPTFASHVFPKLARSSDIVIVNGSPRG